MTRSVKAVGMKHDGREKWLSGLDEGDEVTLVAEPQNPYDSNAIAVYRRLDGVDRQVAYLPGGFVARFALPHEVGKAKVRNLRYFDGDVAGFDVAFDGQLFVERASAV